MGFSCDLFASESLVLPCVPRIGATEKTERFMIRLRDGQYTDAIQYTDCCQSRYNMYRLGLPVLSLTVITFWDTE